MGKNNIKYKLQNIFTNSKILKSVMCGFWCFLLLIAVSSFVFYVFDLDFENAYVASIIIYVASAAFSGYISGAKIREKGIIYGSLSGLLLYCICFIISIFVSDTISLDALYKLIICLLSGSIGGIIGVNKRNKKKIKPRK